MTTRIGDCFEDNGLMLGVLNQLMSLGVFSESTLHELISDIAENEYDEEDEDGDEQEAEEMKARDAMARLADLEVSDADLARIESLDFDGGNSVYMTLEAAIDIDTGGEEEWYQVESLEGFDKLPGVKALNLDGHGFRDAWLDLSPLQAHPALESVVLTGRCKPARVLESLAKLGSVKLIGAELDDKAALGRLAARGVKTQG